MFYKNIVVSLLISTPVFASSDFYESVADSFSKYTKSISKMKNKKQAYNELNKLVKFMSRRNKDYTDSSKSLFIQSRLVALNSIPKNLNKKNCEAIKNKIRINYSPRFNKFTKAPGYVKQALKITDHICKL